MDELHSKSPDKDEETEEEILTVEKEGPNQPSLKQNQQVKCWYCGKITHYETECQKKKGDSGSTN
mgnify:CR=1 FL=1